MRRSLIALAVTALIAVTACSSTGATSAPTAAATAAPPSAAPASSAAPSAAGGAPAVAIKNFAFSPASIDVKVGDKITWTNGDNAPHTVTFDDATVASSGNVNEAQTYSASIAKAGAYAYHCKIHPSMKGTVNVT